MNKLLAGRSIGCLLAIRLVVGVLGPMMVLMVSLLPRTSYILTRKNIKSTCARREFSSMEYSQIQGADSNL